MQMACICNACESSATVLAQYMDTYIYIQYMLVIAGPYMKQLLYTAGSVLLKLLYNLVELYWYNHVLP